MKIKSKAIFATLAMMIMQLATGCNPSVGKVHSTSATVPQKTDGNVQTSSRQITIQGITVRASEITMHGKSTLPNETCINTELLEFRTPLTWWPNRACSYVNNGNWEIKVHMDGEPLQAEAQYALHAYQHDNPQVDATLAFDIQGPPPPSAGE
jgi:hypothetical protein